jgi:hypothetical protein
MAFNRGAGDVIVSACQGKEPPMDRQENWDLLIENATKVEDLLHDSTKLLVKVVYETGIDGVRRFGLKLHRAGKDEVVVMSEREDWALLIENVTKLIENVTKLPDLLRDTAQLHAKVLEAEGTPPD